MYSACNKLFASSRFASDEDGCVRRGDLCYTREYASQTSRSSDNLLEHRDFTRCFARSDVVVLESFFGLPEIRDEYSDGSHELPPTLGTVHASLFSWIVEPVLCADNPRWSRRVHHIGMGGLPF